MTNVKFNRIVPLNVTNVTGHQVKDSYNLSEIKALKLLADDSPNNNREVLTMKIAIIACTILVVQYVFSLIQIRYYRKSINRIVGGYKGDEGYYMFSGMERNKFRPGAIAILVVDKDYIVHECHMLKGISILSKFKELGQYKGQHVGSILNDVNESYPVKEKGKKIPAFGKALIKAGENAIINISKQKISVGS